MLKGFLEQRREIKRLRKLLKPYECIYCDQGEPNGDCLECHGTGYTKLSGLRLKIDNLYYNLSGLTAELEEELVTKNISVEHSLSEGLLEALRG